MKQKLISIYYLILSAIGGALIIFLSQVSPKNSNFILFFDRLIVGVVFISVCIFGISLAIRPNWTKKLTARIETDSVEKDGQKKQTLMRRRKGHHPDCMKFKSHTIKVRSKVYCSGCTGLCLGSIVSIFLMGSFVIHPEGLEYGAPHLFIILGMAFIAQNYIITVIFLRNSLLHLISNIFFVIGLFLVVICIFLITGSRVLGVFAVIISILFLDTRIQLSKFRHSNICKNCCQKCKCYH